MPNQLLNKFTAGEFDQRFLAQVDYDGYRKGARKLRNCFCINTGGVQRRWGTEYNVTLSDGSDDISDPAKAGLLSFEWYNVSSKSNETYWMVFRDNGSGGVAVDIYLDDTFEQTLDPLGTFTTAEIPDIRYLEDTNKIIFFHENHIPMVVVKGTLPTNWTQGNLVFSFYPGYDYSFFDNPTNNYHTNGTTFTPNAADATTLTASQAVFTSNHAGISPNAGGWFTDGTGIFHITTVVSSTVANGYCDIPFAGTSAIKGSESVLFERAWGDGSVIGGAPAGRFRGYPRHGSFFQSRLVVGGVPANPGAAFASGVNDHNNFDNSNSDPSTGWIVEAGITGNDVIQDIVASKSLVLTTDNGSSATNILLETPTIPTNVFLNTQGREAARNMDAVFYNNQILFADLGNTIWSMVYDVPDTGYSIFNAAMLSSHLIRDPQHADVYDPEVVDGRYYMLVNGDGSLAMYNSLLDENIRSWTLMETTGSFTAISCIKSQAKVLVRRQKGTGNTIDGYASTLYTADNTFTVFRNVTDLNATLTGVTIWSTAHTGDYLLVGNEIPFTQMDFTFLLTANANAGLKFEFLNNKGTWEEFDVTTDNTLGFTQSGSVSWNQSDVSNWLSQPLVNDNGVLVPQTKTQYGDYPNYYWLRISNTNALGRQPIITVTKINTQNIINLERISFNFTDSNGYTRDTLMDMTYQTTSDGSGNVTLSGPFIGQNIFVFANNFPLTTFYVPTSGTVDIGVANAQVFVGLEFEPTIVPMPLVALLRDGYSVYEPKSVKNIYIDYYNSLGITVNGQPIPQVSPGYFMTVDAPQPESGYYLVPSFSGWDPRDEVIISQSYPAPFTLRGLSYELEVS